MEFVLAFVDFALLQGDWDAAVLIRVCAFFCATLQAAAIFRPWLLRCRAELFFFFFVGHRTSHFDRADLGGRTAFALFFFVFDRAFTERAFGFVREHI